MTSKERLKSLSNIRNIQASAWIFFVCKLFARRSSTLPSKTNVCNSAAGDQSQSLNRISFKARASIYSFFFCGGSRRRRVLSILLAYAKVAFQENLHQHLQFQLLPDYSIDLTVKCSLSPHFFSLLSAHGFFAVRRSAAPCYI
jgi:hypothetical protein